MSECILYLCKTNIFNSVVEDQYGHKTRKTSLDYPRVYGVLLKIELE